MQRYALVTLAMVLLPACAFAVDGVVLVNQSTVMAAGGFPYVISNPGSYRLSSNLSVTAGQTAIQIATSNVSLDLNGFNVASLGPRTSPFTIPVSGILIIPPVGNNISNIVIRNGTLVGWDPAIDGTVGGQLVTVEDVNIESIFTTGGVSFPSTIAVQTSGRSLLKRVVSDGQLLVSCPAIISESIGFIFTFGGGCVLSNNTAP